MFETQMARGSTERKKDLKIHIKGKKKRGFFFPFFFFFSFSNNESQNSPKEDKESYPGSITDKRLTVCQIETANK